MEMRMEMKTKRMLIRIVRVVRMILRARYRRQRNGWWNLLWICLKKSTANLNHFFKNSNTWSKDFKSSRMWQKRKQRFRKLVLEWWLRMIRLIIVSSHFCNCSAWKERNFKFLLWRGNLKMSANYINCIKIFGWQ